MEKTILITGGTGFVGSALIPQLREKGWTVYVYSRNKEKKENHYYWNPEQGELDPEPLKKVRAIIHLAGDNIGEGAWTAEKKKRILESRVNSSIFLKSKLDQIPNRVNAFLGASGSAFYGNVVSGKVDESSPAGNGFLADVTVLWEESSNKFQNPETRVCTIRTGMVLAGNGGALPRLLNLAKWGLGAPMGHGKQFLPWVHIQDLCRIYLFLLENKEFSGPVNAVAPEALTNSEFMKALRSSLNKPLLVPPAPAFVLKFLLGEKSSLVLDGAEIIPDVLNKSGFKFEFPKLKETLIDLGKKC